MKVEIENLPEHTTVKSVRRKTDFKTHKEVEKDGVPVWRVVLTGDVKGFSRDFVLNVVSPDDLSVIEAGSVVVSVGNITGVMYGEHNNQISLWCRGGFRVLPVDAMIKMYLKQKQQ